MDAMYGEPSWVDHVMWWHIYPLTFVGAPVRSEGHQSGPLAGEQRVMHRLSRIEPWLDHLVDLGLNGLALGPVFESSTHGYDTVDHFRIDPRLGDDADFDRLVLAARARGIRVLLDGVFNHVGRAHPSFRAVEEQGPNAPTADMFHVDWEGWTAESPVRAAVFEGHEQLVALNHDSPAVEDLVAQVMNHWLARGIDGWRLDAAYAVPPAFWGRVLPRVRERHPDAWFTGEVIHGDAVAIVQQSTMDSLTQYELWQGIWHSIADLNLFELKHAIERNNKLLATFVPTTFLGNHDVTRIASSVPDVRHVPHAVALLMTLAGTPMIYAGDEYGMQALKEERYGGDDAVRPEFPQRPPVDSVAASQLPGAGDAASAIEALHRQLIALRRRHPWLHAAHSDVVDVTNTSIVVRTAATGADTIVTALNLNDRPAVVTAAGAQRILAGEAGLRGSRAELSPHGWAVLGR